MIYQRIIGVAAKRPRLLNPRTGIAVATSARSNGSMPDRWRVNSLRSKNAHKHLKILERRVTACVNFTQRRNILNMFQFACGLTKDERNLLP